MAVVVACVGRPGGRVMDMWIDSYTGDEDITCVDHEWIAERAEARAPIPRLSWKEWQHELRANDPHEAESIDGDWRMPATRPSLASLHANPAHSALRRARLFASVGLVWCGHFAGDQIEGAYIDYSNAHYATLWSVR